MRLHEKLKRLCGEKGCRQTDLIKAVGDISKSTMNNWFSGKSKPDIVSAFRIAQVLAVPLEWLVDEDANFPPPQIEHSSEESAVLKLIRALQLDEDEALRRLACPAGEPWIPGSVQNFGNLGPPRYNDAVQGRAHHDPETGELLDPDTSKPRRRRKGS